MCEREGDRERERERERLRNAVHGGWLGREDDEQSAEQRCILLSVKNSSPPFLLSPCSHTVFERAALVNNSAKAGHRTEKATANAKRNKNLCLKKKRIDTHSLSIILLSPLFPLASFVLLSSGWVDREGEQGKEER